MHTAHGLAVSAFIRDSQAVSRSSCAGEHADAYVHAVTTLVGLAQTIQSALQTLQQRSTISSAARSKCGILSWRRTAGGFDLLRILFNIGVQSHPARGSEVVLRVTVFVWHLIDLCSVL